MSTQMSEARHVPADTLPHRLILARAHAGHLTIREAALRCGLGRTSWQNWERGKPIQHRDSILATIADRLGVDLEWLTWGGALSTTPSPPDDGPIAEYSDSDLTPAGLYPAKLRAVA